LLYVIAVAISIIRTDKYMENDSLNNLLKRIERGYSLPSLSPVAIKLVEIASDDACSIEELISLIEKDPSLAVNLLKMANSAFLSQDNPLRRFSRQL
jgi:HD-like signal output (HDOD) protein